MATTVYQYFRPYGSAFSVRFAMENAAGSDLCTAAATIFDAGDFKISKSGGALANTTNLPTQITAGQPLYELDITAAEAAADEIIVTGRDVATGSYLPVVITITTRIALGQIALDATNIGGNVAGFETIGVGTFAGLRAVGGATGSGITAQAGASGAPGIGISAIAGNNPGVSIQGFGSGNGIISTGGATGNGIYAVGGSTSGDGLRADAPISGNGINGRGGTTLGYGITAYGRATNYAGLRAEATLGAGNGAEFFGAVTGNGMYALGGATSGNGILATGQGANVGFAGASGTGAPTNIFTEALEDINGPLNPGSTLRQALAGLVARFYYLVTQTTTQQKQYKSDSATLVGTASVSDDGVTQTLGKKA